MTEGLSTEVKIALEFAKEAHEGQFRKNSGQPYIVHPIAVMSKFNELCSEYIRNNYKFHEYIMKVAMSAALVHDVFEDTPKTKDDLFAAYSVIPGLELFSATVWDVAGDKGLTDTAKVLFPFCNRVERKAIDGARIAQAPVEWGIVIHLLKMCDIMCNTSDYGREDPKYAIQYVIEKMRFSKYLIYLPVEFKRLLQNHLVTIKDDAYSYCNKNGISLA